MKIVIDWGGTKIEGIAIDSKNGKEINRIRVDSPKDNYDKIISKVVEVIENISKGSSETRTTMSFLKTSDKNFKS